MYKVGDKILIVSERTWEFNDEGDMDMYLDSIMTIASVDKSSNFPYKMKEDNGCWGWNDNMIVGIAKNKKSNKNFNKDIKQVIYNPPATIIMWSDDTKTIVKATDNDTYSPIFGFLMAYYQKHSGTTKTQVGKFCDKILNDYNEQIEKKSKGKEKNNDFKLCIANEDNCTCVWSKNICCFECNDQKKCRHEGDICSLSECENYQD